MLARLTVVIISEYIQVSNDYVVPKKSFNYRRSYPCWLAIVNAMNPAQCSRIPLTCSVCLCIGFVVLLLSVALSMTFLLGTPSGYWDTHTGSWTRLRVCISPRVVLTQWQMVQDSESPAFWSPVKGALPSINLAWSHTIVSSSLTVLFPHFLPASPGSTSLINYLHMNCHLRVSL